MISLTDLNDFLGESITDFPKATISNELKKDNVSIYEIERKDSIYGQKSIIIYLTTNADNIIIKAEMSLDKIFMSNFYEEMISKYGYPSRMLNLGEIYSDENRIHDSFQSHSIQGAAVECTFDDDPLIIIWEHQNAKIVIQQHPDNEHFAVSFSSI